MTQKEIASYIDHTLLDPLINLKEIENLCHEAEEYGFASICIPSYYLKYASKIISKPKFNLSTVIAFPYGNESLNSKVEDIKRSIDQGADEVDVVINHSAVHVEDWKYIRDEISTLTTTTHLKDKVIKIIIEAELHDRSKLEELINASLSAHVDYIKTSSSKLTGPVQLDTIKWMNDVIQGEAKIKASGGIKNSEQAISLINAGASRIGTSSGIKIVKECN